MVCYYNTAALFVLWPRADRGVSSLALKKETACFPITSGSPSQIKKGSYPEKKSIMSMAGDSPDKEKDAAPQKNYYKGSTEVATETPLTLTRLETVSRPKRTIFSSCC